MIPVGHIGAGREHRVRRRMSGKRTLAVEKDRNAPPRAGAADESCVCVEVRHDHRHVAIADIFLTCAGDDRLRECFGFCSAVACAKERELLRVSVIDLGRVGKQISFDVPHQRIGAVRLLAEALLCHNGVCARGELPQLQQHLAFRLKHFFIRALDAVDAQRDGHARTNCEQFLQQREHLAVGALQSVDIDRLARNKRLRQEARGLACLVVQTDIAGL